MSKFAYLLLFCAFLEGILTEVSQHSDLFGQPLDFSSVFDTGEFITSLSSNPLSAAILNIDKAQYPQLFDTVVSSSIDSIQTRLAPRRDEFAAEQYGFNPIASQSFLPPKKSSKLVAKLNSRPNFGRIQEKSIPSQFNLKTHHDANYKVYKPDEDGEILSALKKNPVVAAYFNPTTTNIEVSHPLKYRTEDSVADTEINVNYKPNTYVTGGPRVRRYAGGKNKQKVRRRAEEEEEEEEDPYNYKADYTSRPKAFDSDVYSSAYKEDKDSNKDEEFPYDYDGDSGYDHKAYERIKELSEKQAAEIKQNPGNCKEELRDGMSCVTCKDAKTGGNYESCSYVAEPKNNQYAYSKENKFDSKDQPDEPENDGKEEPEPRPAKYEESHEQDDAPKQYDDQPSSPNPEKPYDNYKKSEEDDGSGEKYKGYYVKSSKPKYSEAIRSEDDSEEKSNSEPKRYDYQKALPEFYSDNEPKKDVEHVLAEFKKKDRSACKKVHKNGMTCFQCIDKSGLKHEECMYVSESAPKKSHLAYQELKEFTSKPPTLDLGGHHESESKIVTTSAPAPLPLPRNAAYVVSNSGYGKKLKRKKASQSQLTGASELVPSTFSVYAPLAKTVTSKKIKRNSGSEFDEKVTDEKTLAPPEEFSGDSSKGAFWAETVPKYSAVLGVSLPAFMLARTEHEASFDEMVAGA